MATSRIAATVSQLLAAYQLVAGFTGLLGTLDYAPTWVAQLPGQLRAQGTALMVIIGGTFLVVAVAGGLLALRRDLGTVATILAQGLQIASWSWHGVLYEFTAGAIAGVLIHGGTSEAIIGWRLRCVFDWHSGQTFVRLNVVPVIVIVLVVLLSPRRQCLRQGPAGP